MSHIKEIMYFWALVTPLINTMPSRPINVITKDKISSFESLSQTCYLSIHPQTDYLSHALINTGEQMSLLTC